MKKMSTWFKLPVCCMPSEIGGWMEHVNFGVKGLSSHHCEAIEDAVNNHGRLTEENAKLRELVEFAFKEGAEEGFYGGGYFSMSKSQELLNQLKDQDNDK